MEAFAVSLSACFPKFPHRLSAPHPSPPPPSRREKSGEELASGVRYFSYYARQRGRRRESCFRSGQMYISLHIHTQKTWTCTWAQTMQIMSKDSTAVKNGDKK